MIPARRPRDPLALHGKGEQHSPKGETTGAFCAACEQGHGGKGGGHGVQDLLASGYCELRVLIESLGAAVALDENGSSLFRWLVWGPWVGLQPGLRFRPLADR